MTGAPHNSATRVIVFGATGTAGQGAVRSLIAGGYDVTCVVRSAADLPTSATTVIADVTGSMAAITGAFDVVVSCLASRTGAPDDAWAIDYTAQLNILQLAERVGARQFILLSAICVQNPQLPFQHAKLAFEAALTASGLIYSIVRPTAFFKSLSGQIDRVRDGKPFLVFGNGTLTACKPISDEDLGHFMTSCIDDTARHNKILPIGGPGPAITPLDQAAMLFALLQKPAKIRRVPLAVLTVIYQFLCIAGMVFPKAAQKAELARIGRYYATESMLILDPKTKEYDADLTPESGSDTLVDHYKAMIAANTSVARGDHSVF